MKLTSLSLRPTVLLASMLLIAAYLGAAHFVSAHGSDTSATDIHACVENADAVNPNPAGSAVRIFAPNQRNGDNGQPCPDGWHEVHWAIQGPKGDAGQQGIKGDTGLPGAPGHVLTVPAFAPGTGGSGQGPKGDKGDSTPSIIGGGNFGCGLTIPAGASGGTPCTGPYFYVPLFSGAMRGSYPYTDGQQIGVHQRPVPSAGTLSGFRAQMFIPGTGRSDGLRVEILRNGAPTGVGCTMPAGVQVNATTQCSDVTNQASFQAGDELVVRVTPFGQLFGDDGFAGFDPLLSWMAAYKSP